MFCYEFYKFGSIKYVDFSLSSCSQPLYNFRSLENYWGSLLTLTEMLRLSLEETGVQYATSLDKLKEIDQWLDANNQSGSFAPNSAGVGSMESAMSKSSESIEAALQTQIVRIHFLPLYKRSATFLLHEIMIHAMMIIEFLGYFKTLNFASTESIILSHEVSCKNVLPVMTPACDFTCDFYEKVRNRYSDFCLVKAPELPLNRLTFRNISEIFSNPFSVFLGRAKFYKTPKGTPYDVFRHCETSLDKKITVIPSARK